MNRIKELLNRILRIVDGLAKLIPTLLDVLEDLADDGKRNRSNSKSAK